MLATSLFTAGLCVAVLVGYGVRVARHGRRADPRLGPTPGSPLLPGYWVEAFYWLLHVPGAWLTRLRVEPDTLTYLSVAFSLCSAPLVAVGKFQWAAAAVLLGAALDAMDGMVARARGRASAGGAVLDSFVDRLADAAPYVGLVIFYRTEVWTLTLPLLAMVGSSLVPYARAKADEHKLKLPNGLMRRHERVAYLTIALLVSPLVPTLEVTGSIAYPLTLVVVAVIAAISFYASFVLVARTRAALADRADRALSTSAQASLAPPLREPAREPKSVREPVVAMPVAPISRRHAHAEASQN